MLDSSTTEKPSFASVYIHANHFTSPQKHCNPSPFSGTENSLQAAPRPYTHGNRDPPKIGRFGEQSGFATRKNPHVHAPAVQRQGPGHRAGVDALASVREPDLERHRRPAIRHAPAAGGGGGRERPTGVVGALRQAQPALALPAGTAAGGRHVPRAPFVPLPPRGPPCPLAPAVSPPRGGVPSCTSPAVLSAGGARLIEEPTEKDVLLKK